MGAGKAGFAELEIEENELSDKEEPEEVISEPLKSVSKKNKKSKKKSFVDLAESEEDEGSEEIEERILPKNKKNKKGKRGGFETLVDSEEDIFSEEDQDMDDKEKKIEEQKHTGKKKKKGK